jgi:hypothetical protein
MTITLSAKSAGKKSKIKTGPCRDAGTQRESIDPRGGKSRGLSADQGGTQNPNPQISPMCADYFPKDLGKSEQSVGDHLPDLLLLES